MIDVRGLDKSFGDKHVVQDVAIQVETGQPREAEQSVRRSIELVNRHRPPGHEDLSNSLCRLGDALRCEDRHAEAGAALDECLALIESMKDA